jgi:hypothetical protein
MRVRQVRGVRALVCVWRVPGLCLSGPRVGCRRPHEPEPSGCARRAPAALCLGDRQHLGAAPSHTLRRCPSEEPWHPPASTGCRFCPRSSRPRAWRRPPGAASGLCQSPAAPEARYGRGRRREAERSPKAETVHKTQERCAPIVPALDFRHIGRAAYFVWASPPNGGGTAQRYLRDIRQFVGACGLMCRRGAQVNRKRSHAVGVLERRADEQSVRCRTTCGRGAKVTEILGTGCSTLRLACSVRIQFVDLTGGLRQGFSAPTTRRAINNEKNA